MEWTGYLYEAKPVESLIPASWFDDLAYTVSIKMWPSESHLHPDIVLSVPYTVAEATQIPDFTELARGSEIKFKGMFQAIGNEFKMHHMRALDLSFTGRNVSLHDIPIVESSFSRKLHNL